VALEDEVANYLAGAGLGLTLGSSQANGVFADPFPPAAHDTSTCVVVYSGEESVKAFGPSLVADILEKPRFQVMTRDTPDKVRECKRLMLNINKKLRSLAGVTLTSVLPNSTGSVSYAYVKALGPPFFLKYDEAQRVVYACNYVALKAESPS